MIRSEYPRSMSNTKQAVNKNTQKKLTPVSICEGGGQRLPRWIFAGLVSTASGNERISAAIAYFEPCRPIAPQAFSRKRPM